MGAPVDCKFGPCHAVLSNVASDGTITAPANDTPVLAATLPLTTGVLPIDAASLFALVYVSWDATSADGSKASKREDYLGAVVQGASSPGSVVAYSNFASSADFDPTGSPAFEDVSFRQPGGLRLDTPDGFASWVSPHGAINGAGDYELSFQGNMGGGVDIIFRNLRVWYRVVGSK